MPQPLPAISLVAVPGGRRQTLDIARDVERRGFAGIYVPSRFGNMAQCTALALATEHIPFGTAIAPIYARTAEDFAHSAAYLHEVSDSHFRFGIGIAHGPTYQRLGVQRRTIFLLGQRSETFLGFFVFIQNAVPPSEARAPDDALEPFGVLRDRVAQAVQDRARRHPDAGTDERTAGRNVHVKPRAAPFRVAPDSGVRIPVTKPARSVRLVG